MSATWEIRQGDCVELMAAIPDGSIDAVVCDPPYGIGFMGHDWDQPGEHAAVATAGGQVEKQAGKRRRNHPNTTTSFGGPPHPAMQAGLYDLSPTANRRFQAWCETWAAETLRVLKPGGHMLVCGGTRTYHRMASGIEDAGFEIRDCLVWLYGSGFPKSLDVSKAIDKAAGAEREVLAEREEHDITRPEGGGHERLMTSAGHREIITVATTAPATPEAERWEGWGTALKPGHEPVVVARKPLMGTVAANVLEHGTGALNIDGCRIGTEGATRKIAEEERESSVSAYGDGLNGGGGERDLPYGRWPANVAMDPEAAGMLDTQTGELTSGANPTRRGSDKFRTAYGDFEGQRDCEPARGADSGGASRFYYCAKASRAERNAGLEGFGAVDRKADSYRLVKANPSRKDGGPNETKPSANAHPTVKPIELMRWLVRLVAPPGGTVLDPFNGSGTTGCAALLEGFDYIGLEREAEYVAIAQARLAYWADPVKAEAALATHRAETERRERDETMGALSLFGDEEAA